MAQRYRAEVLTSWAQTRAFDYIADFRNLLEWHPAVRDIRLQSGDPNRRNARYTARARMAGRTVAAEILTVEFERPGLLIAEADNSVAHTTDRFEITSRDGCVSVIYSTELRLKAPLNVIGPLMVPALTQSWKQAAAGLERVLNSDRPAAASRVASPGA